MGTGKSAILGEVISQARKLNLRILFLTNRISLADDIEQKYNNIKHYLGTELEGNNYTRGDDLVCQIDSLYKFSTKFFDVVIMDETSTTMLHLLSLEHHQKAISTKIFSLYKKKLVLADAFIFDDMVLPFSKNSKNSKKSKILNIHNSYRDDIDLELFGQKDNFIFNLIEEAKIQPLTFSSGSMIIINIVRTILEQNNITSITISSETSKEQKQLIYKSFNQMKPKYQVLMYSPSLTVGVSNLNKINTHYHFDSGRSMNVLSSIQMIKRTREAKNIKMFLDETLQYRSTSLEQIENTLSDFNKQDDDGDDIGISIPGMEFAKIQRLYNIMENRHKITFLHLLKLQFKNDVQINDKKIKPFLHKFSKIVKQKEINYKLEIFDKYKLMTPEEISEVEYKLFSTTKEEEFIKLFEFWSTDETLKLPKEHLYKLVQEEIKTPGIIECFKCIQKHKNVVTPNNNYSLTIKDKNSFQAKGINIKDYGYFKEKHLYRLNKVLVDLIKN